VNKSQFIDTLAVHFGQNKKAASEALDAVLDTIAREVARGEKVAITGFGAFEKTVRPARMVRNPRTGQRVRAKKSAVPKFRAGAELKAVVSGAKKLPKVATATVASAKKTATRTTSTAKKSTGTGTAKKSTARKTTAKKTTGTAKKSTAKKATGTARKTTAKKTSGTGTAKKTTAKRATPAKKTTAKKTTAKKASPARKTTAKKSTARKTTAKKS
jgi:DNA-binding protein HU-beta